MKSIILYYSRSGNNRYIANRLHHDLGYDIHAITPRFKSIFFQVLSTFTRLTPGIRKLPVDLLRYDRVILITPIWIGHIIYPVYSFLKRYNKKLKQVYLLSCCGGSDETKDDQFGYMSVFRKYEKLLGDKCISCTAFPLPLSLPEDKRQNDEAIMAARLSDESFKGELEKRYNDFINEIT